MGPNGRALYRRVIRKKQIYLYILKKISLQKFAKKKKKPRRFDRRNFRRSRRLLCLQKENFGQSLRVDDTAGHDEETFAFGFRSQGKSGENNPARTLQQRTGPAR